MKKEEEKVEIDDFYADVRKMAEEIRNKDKGDEDGRRSSNISRGRS